MYDKKVTVEHLATSVSGQETYQAHPGFTWVPMNIQPLSFELAPNGDDYFFKTYKAFTTVSGIVETYRLTVSGTGEQYMVRGRESFNYPPLPHYELILERGAR